MTRRLIVPEPQLQFSAELASAIGLEEAILLQQLRTLYQHQPATVKNNVAWLHISEAYVLQLLPFWGAADLRRLCASLERLGIVRLDRDGAAADSLLLAIDDAPGTPREEPPPAPAPAPAANRREGSKTSTAVSERRASPAATSRFRHGGGEPLPHDFMPSEDMLEILEQFHRVPRGFALQQLEDFTLYWRERGSAGHAWQNKFKQHVQFQWARHQQDRNGGLHAQAGGAGTGSRTRDISIINEVSDTSWVD